MLSRYVEQLLNIYNYIDGIMITDKDGYVEYYKNFRPDLNNLKEAEVRRKHITEDVWNPPVNTGFLFITSWKKIVRLSLPIRNTLRLSVERKLPRKMPNGLLTCLSMILLPEALCRCV